LEEKGYIGYKAYGNTYQYYALVSRNEYRQNSLKRLVNKYFGNSYTRVVSALIEEEALSVDELQELIEQIKNKKTE
jgi:predicted transcriptional regulator